MEDKINKIFELLEDWYQLPKYQLERRIDIFFALYLPKIIEKKLKIIEIIPEFPIKKQEEENNKSTNADYAVLTETQKGIKLHLIELKTDMKSIKKEAQIEYYRNAQSFKTLLEGIITIKKNSSQWEKYEYLLSKLQKNGIVMPKEKEMSKKRDWEIKNIDDDTEIIYIVPNKDSQKFSVMKEIEGVAKDIIDFKDIIEVLDEEDIITRNFKEILGKIYESYNT